MLKKTITYVDFNGNEQTEEFYFNLSKVELTALQVSVDGGMATWLKKITESGNEKEMLGVFERFILDSIGLKSTDGKRFVKNEDIKNDFVSSPAYDVLFMELATDSNKALEFMRGVIPQDMVAQFNEEMKGVQIEAKTDPNSMMGVSVEVTPISG